MATTTVTVGAKILTKGGAFRFPNPNYILFSSSSPSARHLPHFRACYPSFSTPIRKTVGLYWRSPSFCSATTVSITDNSDESSSSSNFDIKDASNMLDIRVGRILRAWRHEEADSLYVEEVDVGEPQPRIICSGLVNYIPLHLLQDRNVVVLANLKPRNMRGVKSFGMLLAASDASHENVELLLPPEGSVPGQRVWFASQDDAHDSDIPPAPPATPNQIQKKKIWELVQPHLKTNTSCIAMLGGQHFMRTSAGLVVCTSLKNANIS